ncbi:MAG TPA: redoxin domain-containing protein [Polyangiaceae bacterium]|nr:redoxin domain-containing protein [Polyangiaceae bacterium]
MARDNGARVLDAGDQLPDFQLSLVAGGRLSIPRDLKHPFSVVLVNRGAFCPYCIAQLRGYQASLAKLSAEGIGVVSFSADSLESAQKVVQENRLEFPVGYGAPVEAAARTLGVYYEPAPTPYLQSAGFVVQGPGKILTAVYSSGPLGRLLAQDVLGFVQYIRAHA